MRHLNKLLFFVAISALVGLAIAIPRSYAGPTLYQTGFEPPTFKAGQPLVGQDGWTGVASPPIDLSPNAAIISTDKPKQGKQSVLVPGKDLFADPLIFSVTGGYYSAIGSYRKPVSPPNGYDTGGKQTVRVSAHVRVDGPQSANNDNFFSASVVAVTPGGEGVGELAISSDGNVYAYSGADLVPTFFTSTPVSLGEWHSLAVEANFATRQSSFFLDDVPLGSFPFDAGATSNLLVRGSMVTYARPDTTDNHKADYTAHFDQFMVKVLGPNGPKK
jgi:hypothetical protein